MLSDRNFPKVCNFRKVVSKRTRHYYFDYLLRGREAEKMITFGNVGTVIYNYEKGASLKVEFASLDGGIVAIETLSAQQVRLVDKQDMVHSRHLNF